MDNNVIVLIYNFFEKTLGLDMLTSTLCLIFVPPIVIAGIIILIKKLLNR